MAGREGEASMSQMITVEEALARVLASAESPLEEEKVTLDAAYGRVLTRDLKALRTQPPFANSAMDGYAVRAADSTAAPLTLTVIGESAAGRAFEHALGPGQAVRIFTGAPMPEGADAIVMQEDVRREGERITLSAAALAGDNLREAGMDFRAGEALIAAGRRLTPRDVALAAAANHTELAVRRRARVAILATGDELVPPGGALGPAQIIASNNFAVAGVVEASGAVAIDLGIAVDEMGALKDAVGRARDSNADVLVTLGGASVGDYDLVQQALTAKGMELGFWRIAMRPGKPLMHGRLGPMRILGLPGNPTSSTVCAVLFLSPLIRALHGEPDPGADLSQPARLAVDLRRNGPRQDYMRASLRRGADGILAATPAPNQDSSLVKTMARADGLIVRAPHAEPAKAGDACRVILFHGLEV
jgi:molybdopterin molybdotransferase